MTKDVEERIREHYVDSESGEWLVEKGKVKEAKLLKEAVHRIEALQKKIKWWEGFRNPDIEDIKKRNQELFERENDLKISQKALAAKYASINRDFRKLKDELERFENDYECHTTFEKLQSEKT